MDKINKLHGTGDSVQERTELENMAQLVCYKVNYIAN